MCACGCGLRVEGRTYATPACRTRASQRRRVRKEAQALVLDLRREFLGDQVELNLANASIFNNALGPCCEIGIYLEEEMAAWLGAAAKKGGMSRSKFIRHALGVARALLEGRKP